MWLGIVVASRCGCFKLRGHLFFGLVIGAARFSRFLRLQPSGVGVPVKFPELSEPCLFLEWAWGFETLKGQKPEHEDSERKGQAI